MDRGKGCGTEQGLRVRGGKGRGGELEERERKNGKKKEKTGGKGEEGDPLCYLVF